MAAECDVWRQFRLTLSALEQTELVCVCWSEQLTEPSGVMVQTPAEMLHKPAGSSRLNNKVDRRLKRRAGLRKCRSCSAAVIKS